MGRTHRSGKQFSPTDPIVPSKCRTRLRASNARHASDSAAPVAPDVPSVPAAPVAPALCETVINEPSTALTFGEVVFAPSYSFRPPETRGGSMYHNISIINTPGVRIARTLYANYIGHRRAIELPLDVVPEDDRTRTEADASSIVVAETRAPVSEPSVAAPDASIETNTCESDDADGQEDAEASRLLITEVTQSSVNPLDIKELERDILELSPRAPQYVVFDDVESIDSERVSYRYWVRAFDMPLSSDNRSKSLSEPTDQPARRQRRHLLTEELLRSYAQSQASEPVNDIISWDEEVRRSENVPRHSEENEPDGWKNPFWSSISRPGTDHCAEPSESDSVEVNAFIYEVNSDYVNNDEQYEELLWNLRQEHSERSETPEHMRAGPSRPRRPRTPRVTVEEVEDKDAHQTESSSTTYMSTKKGKGKKRSKSKRNKRPDLGLNAEALQASAKKKKEKKKRRESEAHCARRESGTPRGFTGGYFEAAHGGLGGHAHSDAGSDNRAQPRDLSGSRPRRLSDRGVGKRGPPGGIFASGGSPSPSDHSSSSESSDSDSDPEYRPGPNPSSGSSDEDDSSGDTESSSSESSSSSSSSESSNGTVRDEALRWARRREKRRARRDCQKIKELQKKILAQARSGFKSEKPEPYDGSDDFTAFELLAFNYDNWVLDTKQTEAEAVQHFSKVLKGKASAWYMADIATNQRRYTMKKIYQELFDYCFPPDFIEKLRKDYERLRQNDLLVQDYFAKSDQLRKRLRGIDDESHIIRLYDGIHPDIKAHLRIMQVEPEDVTLEDLKSKAIAIERALKINKKEKRTDNGNTNNRRDRDRDRDRNRSRSPDQRRKNSGRNNRPGRSDNRNGSRRDDGHRDRRDDRGHHGGHCRDNRDRRTNRSSNWKGSNRRDDSNKKQLTDKERDEHRAANKCFNCHEVGHMAKDSAVKPEQKVRASVALLRELDELTKVKESIEVLATRIQTQPLAQAPKPVKRKQPEQQHVERNAARVKDVTRRVPPTMIVQAELEGESIRVLMDSGSQADLVSSTLVDQLKLQKITLTKPLTLQLAVSGLRGKLQCIVNARIVYQIVDEHRDFDVANIDNYDMILGMPFLHQHSVRLSFNPNAIFIGSARSLPMEGENIIVINSVSADVLETRMDELRTMLREEASDLCKLIKDTPLPPFRDINHTIPIIDESKVYRFCPSQCPEALKPLFEIKAREYLDTGRWKFATGTNAIPMLFLPKKTKDGTVALRTVLDKRKQNSNTRKLTSPLPIIEDILAVVCKYKYKTLLDGKDAYEQIRIEPNDVPRSLFHTPMGTMVSLVMQQGDCNACATYQTLVCHIFSAYIGVFMFVYLDDLIIFSNTTEDHVKHI
ncbi:Transposon Ty3-G Gag-Pol polyprotein [Ceratobasidium sp. AG-Ba]|nr:Transposon Ty3-G Gag-Pol polyprotein [Ceratobasidium sp. AG-Ba]